MLAGVDGAKEHFQRDIRFAGGIRHHQDHQHIGHTDFDHTDRHRQCYIHFDRQLHSKVGDCAVQLSRNFRIHRLDRKYHFR